MRNVSGMELSEVSNKAINKLYVCTTGHASFTLLFLFVHSQKALFLTKKKVKNCEVREVELIILRVNIIYNNVMYG